MVSSSCFLDTCPVCGSQTEMASSRYQQCVCWNCRDTYESLDEDGNVLTFGNVDYTGGFVSFKNGVATSPSQHICYINGVKCCADEARFGGIVIRKFPSDVEN